MHTITLLLVLSALSACHSLAPFSQQDNKILIETLLSQHEYQRAITLLKMAQTNDTKQTLSLSQKETINIEQIQIQAKSYSQQIQHKANKMAQTNNYDAALKLLKRTHSKIPFDPDLPKLIKTLNTKQENHLNSLQLHANTKKIIWLAAQTKSLHAQTKSSKQTFLIKLSHKNTERKKNLLAKKLLEAFSNVLEQEKQNHPSLNSDLKKTVYENLVSFSTLTLPEELTQQANVLLKHFNQTQRPLKQHNVKNGKIPSIQTTHKKLSSTSKSKTSQKQKTTPKPQPNSNNTKTELKKTMDALDKAIEAGDLVQIKKILDKTQTQANLPLEMSLRTEAIKNFIEHQIIFLDQQADQLYKTGHIADANTIWTMLLKIDTKNQTLQTKHARSQRVLENLNELRKDGHTAKQQE